jgi:signal transduction histidine kinase
MRRRLLASTALIALAAVVVLGVPLGIVEAHRARSDALSSLEREADGVSAAVDDRLERRLLIPVASLTRLVRPGHRVTVVAPGRAPIVVGAKIGVATIDQRASQAQGAVVTASAPATEVNARIRNRWLLIAGLSAGGVAAAVLLGFMQGRRLARPLESLAQTSRQLGTGDFSARADRSAVPEIDAVAEALDATAVRIAQLVGREREFSVNVSHQLRTPLTALRLRLEEIQALGDDEAIVHEAKRAEAEADRLERTIRDLLTAAPDGRAGPPDPVAVDDLARAHLAHWRPLFRRAGRALVLTADRPILAAASSGALGQGLDVLLDNALRHGAGRVTVHVQRRDGWATVTVGDEGGGLPPGADDTVFDRGRSLRGGTGVGLHLARTLIEAEGGQLVISRPSPPLFEIRLRPAA